MVTISGPCGRNLWFSRRSTECRSTVGRSTQVRLPQRGGDNVSERQRQAGSHSSRHHTARRFPRQAPQVPQVRCDGGSAGGILPRVRHRVTDPGTLASLRPWPSLCLRQTQDASVAGGNLADSGDYRRSADRLWSPGPGLHAREEADDGPDDAEADDGLFGEELFTAISAGTGLPADSSHILLRIHVFHRLQGGCSG